MQNRSGPASSSASTSTPGRPRSTCGAISRNSSRSLSCMVVIVFGPLRKNGRGAPISPNGEMWYGDDSSGRCAARSGGPRCILEKGDSGNAGGNALRGVDYLAEEGSYYGVLFNTATGRVEGAYSPVVGGR